MLDKQRPKRPDTQSLDTKLEDAKQELRYVARFGKKLCDLESAVGLQKSGTIPHESWREDRLERLRGYISARMPMLRKSLEDPKLFDDAIDAYYELMVTTTFGSSVSDTFAELAPVLNSALEHYPHNAARIIQLMREAFQVATPTDEEDPVSESAKKMRQAIRTATPSLQVFFSEANPAAGAERKERLDMLQDISKICEHRESQWVMDALAKEIANVVRSPEYVPEQTIDNSLARLLARARGEKVPAEVEAPPHAVTHGDIETIFTDMPRHKSTYLLEMVFLDFGITSDVYAGLIESIPMKEESVPTRYIAEFMRALDQLRSIAKLESTRPGAAKELFERFGIQWFSRYPTQVLIDQYDSRDKPDQRYGIFMSALSDWNEGFFTDNDKGVVEKAWRQLKSLGYQLRIIEVGGRSQISERFIEMDALYGSKHKASFLFIRAHAAREHMELGPDADDGDLEAKHLEDPEIAGLRECFEQNPLIVIDGCSVGRKGGFAQKLSKVYAATVHAAKGITSALTDIQIEEKDGRLKFAPVYDVTKDEERLPPHIYINGRKR